MRISDIFVVGTMLALAGCVPTQKPSLDPGATAGTKAEPVLPGKQQDGSVLLHNQWSLMPAGTQVDLEDFPVNIAIHPAGRFAAVLHCGYGKHRVIIVDIPAARVVHDQPIKEGFYGVTFSRDGRRLFCSGAADEVVHEFDFDADKGSLSERRSIALRDKKQRAIPAGMAINRAGDRLYVANVLGHRVSQVQLGSEPAVNDILLGTNVAELSVAPVQPSLELDIAAISKRSEAALYPSKPSDTYPYACCLDEAKERLYVSLWAQGSVAVIDLKTHAVQALWPAEDHPCEMVLSASGKLLYVANANRNTVTVLDTASGKRLETIWAALFPHSPPGSTPNSLALSPDEKLLFVANADNNAVAVFDVSRVGKTKSLGFIPAGWYTTSVRVTPDGKKLLIANGRGTTPRANPKGPQPGVRVPRGTVAEYIGGLYRGTLSIVDIPNRKQFERELARYTAQTYRCSPLNADASVHVPRPNGNPVPLKPGDSSPIKHCIYIIKENRTYDQMLGDMPEGRGDPKLCLFPENITPNHHKLAREFILLDNFYVNSEVSADGHEWSMGAYATDFVKKSWPLSYGHNGSGKYAYPAEGSFPIAAPAGGYLWDRAREAGVSYFSFGEWVANGKTPNDPGRAKAKALEGHFDPMFRTFDLNYPDVKRAERFISQLKGFEERADMPRLMIIRLPNDHTSGTAANAHTPSAAVADNDVALGMVIEAISHSPFWPSTAVFVLEDDAQNGPDHIDAHRSPAFVISPYTRRGTVDSSMYSTTSMLRTMELILGLKPMSQYDAAARPMYNAFQAEPDLRPYKSVPANVDLEERNKATAWGSQFKMNFAVEDAADDLLLNEVIWRSVKGANNPMPAPVRAAFVRTGQRDRDDD